MCSERSQSALQGFPESPPKTISLISSTTQGKLGNQRVYLGTVPTGEKKRVPVNKSRMDIG